MEERCSLFDLRATKCATFRFSITLDQFLGGRTSLASYLSELAALTKASESVGWA
jgi:hypothetical protein